MRNGAAKRHLKREVSTIKDWGKSMTIDKQTIADSFKKNTNKVILGIDGYVDEVWQLVESRDEESTATLFTRMSHYAERIMQTGGGGMSVEIVRKRRGFGGFTANTGNAVARLGVDTTMLSLYGAGTLDPVFEPFLEMCRVISVGAPATTHIFEFDDGKIMLPYVESILGFNWQSLLDALGRETVVSLLAESSIIALGYWSSMPTFDEVIAQVCACLPNDGKPRRIFTDFAELRKRSEASLVSTLRMMKELNKKIPITFSMNEHEGAQVFALYNEPLTVQHPPSPEQIENVRRQLGLDEIVVHTPYYAAAATTQEGTFIAAQEFCEKPVRTTGAGDTFNGSYIAACAAGLSIAQRLWFANTGVSYFLNNGEAPSLEQILGKLT